MPVTASTALRRVAKSRAARSVEPFFEVSAFRPETGVLWLLRRTQMAIFQLIAEATELGGSTLPQWVALYRIHRGEADTVADLARCCTVDAGSMTRLLDRLSERGLCRRVRSQTDRRVVHIELTAAGVAAAEQIPHVLCRVYNEVLGDFTTEEWTQLRSLLERVAGNAEGLLSGKAAGQDEPS
ncbi:MAG: MarR family transcriptional regulator [Desulfobulbus sp.]|nr:MarR family transcriptional regulator [Desulfobulbus sp.]